MGLITSKVKYQSPPFYGLPTEVMQQIFSYLNTKDLKNCLLVSRLFYYVIDATEVLSDISAYSYCIQKMNKPPLNLFGSTLKLKFFFDVPTWQPISNQIFMTNDFSRNLMVAKLWFTKQLLPSGNFITELELINSDLSLNSFNMIIAALPNLHTLNWNYTVALHHQNNFRCDDENYIFSDKAKNILTKLKKLSFRNASLGYVLIATVNRQFRLVPEEKFILRHCTGLEILEMKQHFLCEFRSAFNSQHDFIKRQILPKNSQILQKNCKTLKELKWIGFIPLYGQNFNLNRRHETPLNLLDFRQQFTKPRVERRTQFQHNNHDLFRSFLMEMRLKNWLQYGLNLTKLDLSFPIVTLCNDQNLETQLPLFDEIFLPFLRQQTQLKQFSLGQIYAPDFNILQKLEDYIDSSKCILNLQIIDSVQTDQNMINLEVQGDDGLANLELQMALSGRCRRNIKFDNNDIINHRDSTVQLNFYQPESVIYIYFVTWKFLDPDFVMKNLSNLTKLMIYQGGVPKSKQIIIKDEEIQQIILNGQNLTHLYIEHCNLENVTDFGITGIIAVACNRMLANKDFTIQDDDLAGVRISSLKSLMHLTLRPLGNKVTDVTAHFGFEGMKMKSFFIATSNISDYGKNVIRNGFVNHNTIKCRIY